MNEFLLAVLSCSAVVSGLLVITSKNPVISVLFLISVFVNVAGYLLTVGIGFVGLSYIVVYVGAVTVLFLFVIMMINLQSDELHFSGNSYTQSFPLACMIGGALFYQLLSVLTINGQNDTNFTTSSVSKGVFSNFNNSLNLTSETANLENLHQTFSASPDLYFSTISSQQVQSIANSLYTHGAIWLMILAFILLLAMISPIVLSLPTKNTN